jgi:Zn-dependent peptidase ImmA (M78 family)
MLSWLLSTQSQRNVIMMTDIPTILIDLPVHVHGFVCLGSDYEPIIIINARMSREQQLQTYKHEMKHIQRGDMYNINYIEYMEG